MTKWLTLLIKLIGGITSLTEWLGNRQLIDAGIAKQLVENLKQERITLEKAKAAYIKAYHAPLDTDDDGVPDDDGYRRD